MEFFNPSLWIKVQHEGKRRPCRQIPRCPLKANILMGTFIQCGTYTGRAWRTAARNKDFVGVVLQEQNISGCGDRETDERTNKEIN